MNLFANLENKIIFLKHGIEKKPHLEMVEELGDNLTSMTKIGVKPYRIDVTNPENMSAIIDFLISRGSKLDEKTVTENSFILANKFNDIWF